jgi:hypothetical protein
MLDAMTSIVAMGRIGEAIVANEDQRAVIQSQKTFLEQQEELATALGSFNSTVIQRSGEKQISSIAKAMMADISNQKNNYARRGVDFVGSPSMMVANTVEKYWNAAHEVAQNTAIDRLHSSLGVWSMIGKYRTMSANLDMQQKMNDRSLFDSLTDNALTLAGVAADRAKPSLFGFLENNTNG